MSEFKKVVDVLEVAVRIERQGSEFYNKLYNTVTTSETKDVFSFLAAEEEKHSGVFRKMLEKVADYHPRFNYPGEYGLFIDGVASYLLEKIEKKINLISSQNIDEAIDLGIELEKETILFYSELKAESQFDASDQKNLEKIIDEERSHWRKLINFKNKISS